MTSQSGHGFLSIFFGGKYDLIQLHRQIIHQNDGISIIHEKLIETITHQDFLLKILRKQWKWHGCMCNLFWFLLPAPAEQNSCQAPAVTCLLVAAVLGMVIRIIYLRDPFIYFLIGKENKNAVKVYCWFHYTTIMHIGLTHRLEMNYYGNQKKN